MEMGRTIQTAFRFSPNLIRMMKNKARRNNLSLNRYVESLIEKDLSENESEAEKLDKWLRNIKLPTEVSEQVNELSIGISFSPREIENDERLAYILSK